MPDPEITDEQQQNSQASEKELGVKRDEESGRIEADWDAVVDGIAKEKNIIPASAVVKDDGENDENAKDGDTEGDEGGEESDDDDNSDDKSGSGDEQPDTGEEKGGAGKDKSEGAGKSGDDSGEQAEKDDLDALAARLDPHARPKTKQIIEDFKVETRKARQEAIDTKAKVAELEKQLDESKKRALPKEVEDELASLRETVRTLDASKDPALVQKYDKRIQSNEGKIIDLLKANGFGQDAEGKEKPAVIEALKRQGLNRRALSDTIKKLRDAGQHEDADEVEQLLRDNSNLSHDRANELEQLKSTSEQRAKAKADEAKATTEANQKKMVEGFTKEVNKYDFLKQPPAVDKKAEPGVQKQQQAAITAFNDSVAKISETIRTELATDVGINTTARVGILLRDHVVPRLQKQIADLQKQLGERESKIKGYKAAGDLANKGGTQKPRPPAETETDAHASFDEVVDAAARKAGVLK